MQYFYHDMYAQIYNDNFLQTIWIFTVFKINAFTMLIETDKKQELKTDN